MMYQLSLSEVGVTICKIFVLVLCCAFWGFDTGFGKQGTAVLDHTRISFATALNSVPSIVTTSTEVSLLSESQTYRHARSFHS